MTKIKENNILKFILSYLGVHGSKEVDKLIEKKNEFSRCENFGLIWIISQLTQNKQLSLLGTTEEEEILVRQWLEYASSHLCPLSYSHSNDLHFVVQELSEILSDRVFLAGNKMTLADLVFYYIMHSTVNKLSLIEKEKYVHLSRWFGHVQQNRRIRQSNAVLLFSRNIIFK